MSDSAFNTMMTEMDSFTYDQCVLLLSRLTQIFSKKKGETENKEISPIDKYFGSVSEEDSDKMLEAVMDCRRIEPNEW
jgi:hypothetical protein